MCEIAAHTMSKGQLAGLLRDLANVT